MEPRAYLAELGYTNEDIAAMLADEKQAKLITAAARSFGEGRTLKQQAEAEKAETTTFWEQKTQELQGSVTRLTAAEKKAAEADADRARYAAYLKSLKDQGYDVPDSLLQAQANPATVTPQYVTREDFQKGVRGVAPDLVSLTALSNEYYDLFGSPYIAVEEDFRAAQQAGKSLRDFARQKYGFDAKRQEKQNAASEAAYQKRFADDIAKEKAKWAEQHGGNPETRSPMPSKFDKLTKDTTFKSDSWKSPEGREANRATRLKKFENLQIQ